MFLLILADIRPASISSEQLYERNLKKADLVESFELKMLPMSFLTTQQNPKTTLVLVLGTRVHVYTKSLLKINH